MIKAKEVSMKNIAFLVAVSFAVSAVYFVSRPHISTTKSMLIFAGEEVVVHKAVRAMTGERAEKVVRAIKAETVPMPEPKILTPLPIAPPSVAFKILPIYPSTALEKGLQGAVLLSVYVGLSGQPEKIETKTSSGVSELDKSAIDAVSQWKFTPAAQGGAVLASWFEIPVRFEVK